VSEDPGAKICSTSARDTLKKSATPENARGTLPAAAMARLLPLWGGTAHSREGAAPAPRRRRDELCGCGKGIAESGEVRCCWAQRRCGATLKYRIRNTNVRGVCVGGEEEGGVGRERVCGTESEGVCV